MGCSSRSRVYLESRPPANPLNPNTLVLRTVIAPLVEGIPAVILPKFLPETFLQAVSRYRITIAMVVPPILLMLANHPSVPNHDLSSLQMLMSAAAPLGKGLTDQVLNRLRSQGGETAREVKIAQAYGLTEVSGANTSLKLEYCESKAGSVGTPWATFQYKVVGEDGEDLAPGETGELCMRGRGVMKGYWRNEKATNETFLPGPERWFKTGDSVHIDRDGFI
jgi:4-coumarate--CoA ligase